MRALRSLSVVASFVIVAAALCSPQKQHNSFLETELIAMGMVDQEVRDRLGKVMHAGGQPSMDLFHEMERIDRENLARLKEIVRKHGWPTVSLVGKEASKSAFLIVQHGIHDVPFMLECLKLMEAHLSTGEVNKSNYALLYDRTALHTGKKQRYGSQVEFKNGKWVMKPCEDPANVDTRRKSMGLPPMSEYLKIIEREFGKGG